jgi:hypothetical protein
MQIKASGETVPASAAAQKRRRFDMLLAFSLQARAEK